MGTAVSSGFIETVKLDLWPAKISKRMMSAVYTEVERWINQSAVSLIGGTVGLDVCLLCYVKASSPVFIQRKGRKVGPVLSCSLLGQ